MRRIIDRRILIAILGYTLTIFLVIVVAYGAIGYAFGSIPYYVVSDRPSSMSPAINYGDIVVTYKVAFSDLKPGDIIVFHDPLANQLTVVHRVVQILPNCPTSGNTCLATKGDNNATNPSADTWNVTQQFYLGRVILTVPLVGFLTPTLWASEGPLGYAPIVFVITLATFCMFVYDESKKAVKADSISDRKVEKLAS